jgi:hypothetical protein
MEPGPHTSHFSPTIKKFADWAALVGTTLLGGYFFGFLIYHSWRRSTPTGSWFLTIIDKHFPATIGLPLSAVSSLCVVLALRAATGPIEFEALGFKFQGASGPLVFWLLSFIAMIHALWLLWPCV